MKSAKPVKMPPSHDKREVINAALGRLGRSQVVLLALEVPSDASSALNGVIRAIGRIEGELLTLRDLPGCLPLDSIRYSLLSCDQGQPSVPGEGVRRVRSSITSRKATIKPNKSKTSF